jgi:predicted GNAT family acetyltransferase
MEIRTRHQPENERFVVETDSGEATLEYRHAGTKTLDYKSTFVPEEERSQGIGEQMVLDALDWARDNDYSVIPTCPFVKAVVKRHEEYQDLVVREVEGDGRRG